MSLRRFIIQVWEGPLTGDAGVLFPACVPGRYARLSPGAQARSPSPREMFSPRVFDEDSWNKRYDVIVSARKRRESESAGRPSGDRGHGVSGSRWSPRWTEGSRDRGVYQQLG